MKKQGILNLLSQMNAESEDKSAEELEIIRLRILDLLLDYINDPQIREAVEEIPVPW